MAWLVAIELPRPPASLINPGTPWGGKKKKKPLLTSLHDALWKAKREGIISFQSLM